MTGPGSPGQKDRIVFFVTGCRLNTGNMLNIASRFDKMCMERQSTAEMMVLRMIRIGVRVKMIKGCLERGNHQR